MYIFAFTYYVDTDALLPRTAKGKRSGVQKKAHTHTHKGAVEEIRQFNRQIEVREGTNTKKKKKSQAQEIERRGKDITKG